MVLPSAWSRAQPVRPVERAGRAARARLLGRCQGEWPLPRRTGMPWSCRGPQHRIDGAVQMRGDLRRAPPPVLVQLLHRVQPLPVHDLPPTQTLRGGPHRVRHYPGPAAASGAARPPAANTHLVDRVDRVDRVPWSRVAEVSGDLRRSLPGRDADPPQPPRSDGPVAARPWYSGDPAGHPAPGRGRARSAVTVGVTCYSPPISGGRAGCGFRTTVGYGVTPATRPRRTRAAGVDGAVRPGHDFGAARGLPGGTSLRADAGGRPGLMTVVHRARCPAGVQQPIRSRVRPTVAA